MEFELNEEIISFLREEKGLTEEQVEIFKDDYAHMTDIERSYVIYEIVGKELYKEPPVDIETFIHDPYFLGSIYSTIIFPLWEKVLKEIYPAPFCKRYNEALLSCATRCFGKGTRVRMYDGSVKNIEDITVGEKVMGDDITPRNVLDTVKGYGTLYDIVTDEGLGFTCNDVHNVPIYDENGEYLGRPEVNELLKYPEKYKNVYLKKTDNINSYTLHKFTIQNKRLGWYYGFLLDGNHLFQLAGGLIQSNSGKSTVVVISALYELHLLLCMISPSKTLGLKDSANITFVLLSKDNPTACSQLGEDMHKGLTLSPYFRDVITNNLSFSALDKKGVQITNNILLKAGSTVNVITGTDLIFGCLDEANMPSPKIAAENLTEVRTKLYTAMVDRRNATFSKAPALTGMIWLTSSPMDEGDVIGERINLIKDNDVKNVFILDNIPRWEARNEYSDDTFDFFLGSNTQDPCIIEETDIDINELAPDKIIHVPRTTEYLTQFRSSPRLAIQEIAGRRTVAENAFFNSVSVFREVFAKENNIFRKDDLRVSVDSMTDIQDYLYDKEYFKHPENPNCFRYIHLDMAEKKDRFGIASVYCNMVNYTSEEGEVIRKRKYYIDFCIGVSSNGKTAVDLLKVLEFIYGLKKDGYPVKKVSTDSHQGELARQILRRHGVATEYQSVEKDKDAYYFLKNLILTKTLVGFKNPLLTSELAGLRETNKRIEKSKSTTDDLSDALAGACFLASQDPMFQDHNEAITELLNSGKNVAGTSIEHNRAINNFDVTKFNDINYLQNSGIYVPPNTNLLDIFYRR